MSRQFEHLTRQSLTTLRDTIERNGCALTVEYERERRQFVVCARGTGEEVCVGRYQVVSAFIGGCGLGVRNRASAAPLADIYLIARRELGRGYRGTALRVEMWEHVVRLCESPGCKPSLLREDE